MLPLIEQRTYCPTDDALSAADGPSWTKRNFQQNTPYTKACRISGNEKALVHTKGRIRGNYYWDMNKNKNSEQRSNWKSYYRLIRHVLSLLCATGSSSNSFVNKSTKHKDGGMTLTFVPAIPDSTTLFKSGTENHQWGLCDFEQLAPTVH